MTRLRLALAAVSAALVALFAAHGQAAQLDAERVLAALLRLPNTDLAATPERGPMVAAAIHRAAEGDPRVAALLISVGQHESRFLDRIQAGQCRRFECDPIHVRGQGVRFQSRSYWQLQRRATASGEEWRSTTGLAPENVSAAALAAANRIRRGMRACRTTAGVVSYYAYGSCRPWPGASKRAALAARIESRLRAPP